MAIEYQLNFILDSGSANALNKSDDGSRFNVVLQRPIAIPSEASYAYLTVYDASIWNNIYNIQEGVNDTWYIEYDDGMVVTNDTIVLLPGLYDVDHLNSALLRELENHPIFPDNLFNVIPDTATSRTVIQFNFSGVQIDFTFNDTPRDILGFDARLVPLVPTTGIQYSISDNEAQFNNINYFLISSDIIHEGLRINDTYYQTIAKVPITAKPGSLINYQPQNVPKLQCNELIGALRSDITVWISNELLQPVNTNGETWSVAFNIHYGMESKHRVADNVTI